MSKSEAIQEPSIVHEWPSTPEHMQDKQNNAHDQDRRPFRQATTPAHRLPEAPRDRAGRRRSQQVQPACYSIHVRPERCHASDLHSCSNVSTAHMGVDAWLCGHGGKQGPGCITDLCGAVQNVWN